MKQRLFSLWLLVMAACWPVVAVGQEDLRDLLLSVEDSTIRITDIGIAVSDVEQYVKTDTLTQRSDTVIYISQPEIVWESDGCSLSDPSSIAAVRRARNARRPAGVDGQAFSQYGTLMEYFQSFFYCVFKFEYESVDAEGKPVKLSAMAACPTKDGALEVNNIVIGTHITITADRERPSSHFDNFKEDDWGMLFSMAAGPKMVLTEDFQLILGGVTLGGPVVAGVAGALLAPLTGGLSLLVSPAILIAGFVYECDQLDKAIGFHAYNNNLVIMPDYEGYGVSKDRAHPYLYQELTARQCVDATLAGIKLYENATETKWLRHPIRQKFRSMSCGYSQGGSVALAVHRFIEQNHLEKTLHFTGSLCGDGPYDPIATLMFFIRQNEENMNMSMPVALPLIVKGMLDTNPYMKGHKAEDYFTKDFLDSGIMEWLQSKEYSTGDIEHAWDALKAKNPNAKNWNDAKISEIMNKECFDYFHKLYNANKYTFTSAEGVPLPTKRGVMEDLHLALASNDLITGWIPKNKVYLFHSKGDTVVPYENAERAENAFGKSCILEELTNGGNHNDSGVDFFKGDSNADVVLGNTMNLRLYVKAAEILNKNY
jgi:predicted esterase